MKTHTDVSSSRRKQRRAHFSAPSHIRRRLMSSSLSKDLRKKYNVRSLPIKRGDEVTIATGKHKGSKGKVTSVYRKRWVIHIEKITRMKANGASQQIPIQPSNVIIIKPQLSKDRRDLLERKAARGKAQKGKGEKHTTETTKKN